MSFLKNTKIMGALVLIVVVALGWWYWNSSQNGGGSAVVQVTPDSPASQDLLSLLSSLHSITLDSSIFTDPNFEALSDFGVTIPDEPAGRVDPFAPIGSQTQTSSTSISQ